LDLYRRAREGVLSADDTIPLADAIADNTANFVERIYCDMGEFNRHFAEFGKTYDIFRKFGPHETVLDVGAHWGYSAIAMRHQGCRSKIVSIEALATNAPSLSRLKSLERGMYHFLNVAASDSDKTIRLLIPVINGHAITGLATTGRTFGDARTSVLAGLAAKYGPPDRGPDQVRLAIADVPALPLDEIVSNLGPIAAIKMDIEGHEPHALRGARRLLSEQKPLLMIEGGNKVHDVVTEMRAHGYQYCERVDGVLMPQTQRSAVIDGFWVHMDRIAAYSQLGIFAPGATTS
jgi:FkbM family methyltransferase